MWHTYGTLGERVIITNQQAEVSVPEGLKGLLFDIKRYAIHDGPGIRVTCFMQGCPLNCWWCHNPESMRRLGCTDGATLEMTVDEVLAEVEKDRIFMDETGGGVTFSGGEPLMQPDFLAVLLQACRERGLHTTLDTSGHAPVEIFNRILPEPDLFLYDLKVMDDGEHRLWTGVSNRLILDNFRTLCDSGRPLVVRFPVVPGFTDSEANLEAFGKLVAARCPTVEIQLLAYHRAAESKYRRLGLQNRMEGVEPPTQHALEVIRDRLGEQGLQVRIGAA